MTPSSLQEVLAIHRSGRLAEAEALYLRLAEITPEDPALHHLLGVVAFQTGRMAVAAERMGRAVALKPDFAEALSNLGNALKMLGRPMEALDHYRRAITAKPDLVDPHFNMGCVLQERNQLVEAAAAYETALGLKPDHVEALCNLALVHRDQDHMPRAVAALERALAIRPDHTDSLSNLGLIRLKQDRLGEAVELLRRAVASNPRHVRANANLGLALEELGEVEAAAEAHGRAMALDPAFDEPLPNLVHLRRKLCRWERFAEDDARLVAQVRDGRLRVPPFIVLHAASATQADHQAAARRWAAEIKAPENLRFDHGPRTGPGPIHVGYLSVDLRGHPVGRLVTELLERHDRTRFRISAYSYGEDDGSPTRRRLEAAVDSFVDIRGLTDAEAAGRIHADGVDILVDITGYTTGARTAILAARPAPVQASFCVGYPGTLGADFVDYLVADPAVAPSDERDLFDERVLHLPHTYFPFDTRREIPETGPGRVENGLPEHGVVFCCFHTAFKITPPFFDIWMRLLNAVPGSVLWLLTAAPTTTDTLRREAVARGVDPTRLVFAPRVEIGAYLHRHRLADLYLDVLPYNAHGSALDALWMGLPVLTCVGETFPGRVAGRILDGLGLPELVARDLADYEARALELARDPVSLARLRARLEQARTTSPIFDMGLFVSDMERLYERMAREALYCQDSAPLVLPPGPD